MKLTVQQVYDATQALTQIINRNAPLPTKGQYRVLRMHTKLLPEYTPINTRRNALIEPYNYTNGAGTMAVPDDKLSEFMAAWGDLAKEEIEVDVEAIPFEQIDLGDKVPGSITTLELMWLGDLVKAPAEMAE